MKKKITIIIIIAIIATISAYMYIKVQQKSNSNYEAEKTRTETNTTKQKSNQNNEESTNTNSVNNLNSTQSQEMQSTPSQSESAPQPPQSTEAEEIASFSTKIYTKDSSRQNNITLTCSTLNDTDVANGETFSFCNTVGRSSPSKGYTKADIFTDGKKTKGYGGGNCQVSTTLYNAVLKVPELKVTERHEHSNKVPYIEEGKDAAVAFGSYDFKFINNTGNAIRIKARHTSNSVNISIIKLL